MPVISDTYQPVNGEAVAKSNKERKAIRDALNIALNRRVADNLDEDGKPKKKLQVLAERMVDDAVDGDNFITKEVIDRTEGKAAQAVTLAAPDGGPILLWGTKPE